MTDSRPRKRDTNITVLLTEEERSQLHELARAEDLAAAQLVRRWIRDAWTARHTKR